MVKPRKVHAFCRGPASAGGCPVRGTLNPRAKGVEDKSVSPRTPFPGGPMDQPRRAVAAALALALAVAPAAAAEPWQPLALTAGRCEAALSTDHADDQFLLVVGTLARGGGPFPFTVAAGPTSAPAAVPLDRTAPDPAWQARVRELAARQAQARSR